MTCRKAIPLVLLALLLALTIVTASCGEAAPPIGAGTDGGGTEGGDAGETVVQSLGTVTFTIKNVGSAAVVYETGCVPDPFQIQEFPVANCPCGSGGCAQCGAISREMLMPGESITRTWDGSYMPTRMEDGMLCSLPSTFAPAGTYHAVFTAAAGQPFVMPFDYPATAVEIDVR
jgi:hypothetical protein